MSVSASEEHAISFFKALLEIVSLKFIHFIIIQSDRYGKPVGREVNFEQMIAWYMGKTSQNQLNPQEKRKRKKLFHALLGRCYLKVAFGVVKADCIFVRFQVSLPWKKSFLWPMQFFAPYTTSTRNAISHFIVIDVNRLMSYSRQNKLVW